MAIVKNTRRALREERRENERLTAENSKLRADLAYVAMMTDVELDEEDADNEQDV